MELNPRFGNSLQLNLRSPYQNNYRRNVPVGFFARLSRNRQLFVQKLKNMVRKIWVTKQKTQSAEGSNERKKEKKVFRVTIALRIWRFVFNFNITPVFDENRIVCVSGNYGMRSREEVRNLGIIQIERKELRLKEYEKEKQGLVFEIMTAIIVIGAIFSRCGVLDQILLKYPQKGLIMPYLEWLDKNMLGTVGLI